MLGLCFSALYMLSLGRFSVLLAYLCGISAGWILKTIFFPNYFVLEDLWKFGYSQAITPLVAILASTAAIERFLGPLGTIVFLLFIAAANLMFDFRSMFGIAAAVALFCMLKYFLDAPCVAQRLSPVSFIVIILWTWCSARLNVILCDDCRIRRAWFGC